MKISILTLVLLLATQNAYSACVDLTGTWDSSCQCVFTNEDGTQTTRTVTHTQKFEQSACDYLVVTATGAPGVFKMGETHTDSLKSGEWDVNMLMSADWNPDQSALIYVSTEQARSTKDNSLFSEQQTNTYSLVNGKLSIIGFGTIINVQKGVRTKQDVTWNCEGTKK